MGKFNSTSRFSDRVENYIKYRPNYPQEVISFLTEKGILHKNSVVADMGSGTGISAELFLKNGNVVFGIEPNEGMRLAAERLLALYTNFRSVDASAEKTGLESASIDLVIAGQAFHWFDVEASKAEFRRILRPGGTVGLLWNDRKTEVEGFLKEYEALLQAYSTDYKEVNHKNMDAVIFDAFFGKGRWQEQVFHNVQVFDFEGLKGRLLSSSYAPAKGHPKHEPMLKALKELFDKYQKNNSVMIDYDTRLFYGKLDYPSSSSQ
jgi:SAM-dependent methyltransferase